MSYQVESAVGGTRLLFEVGKMAKQADGAVWVQYGETVLLVAAVTAREAGSDRGFLPLTVDYREKAYAGGKIPGGFFKREGRPTEKEILSARMTDRPIRPLFPKGMRNETQVAVNVISADGQNDADILAINGASVALCIGGVPFAGPIAAVRVGRVDGQFIVNPTFEEQEKGDLKLVVAASEDALLMLEGGGKEVAESDVLQAIECGQDACRDIIALQRQIIDQARKDDRQITEFGPSEDLVARVKERFSSRMDEINRTQREKLARSEAMKALRTEVEEAFPDLPEDQIPYIRNAVGSLEKESLRRMVLDDGIRADGRGYNDIRPISCEVGLLPRAHGSALFTRGQTQALAATTLGTAMDEQKLDLLEGLAWKRYMLHYNFPPFSVGEVRPIRGPGRREIGHGALAERALKPVLPEQEDFPYTVRVVSEVLESNGSSSMATVCASSLSLMDAGVPIPDSVAGIAMGLVAEGDKTAILTDILGIEDHLGDMDFKLAGTHRGMTSIQMDNKIAGISFEVLEKAFDQARDARLSIMEKMAQALDTPRATVSVHAPKIVCYRIPQEKIGELIGPGGRVIRRITEESGADISVEDDGLVSIAAAEQTSCDSALQMVKNIVEDPEVGRIYEGKVVSIKDFGAFVEILPGRDGLLHISEIDEKRIDRVEDVLQEGDEVLVKVIGIDGQGKIKLSRRAVLAGSRG